MKTWGAGLWAFFIALCALIVGVVLVVCRQYVSLGIMKYYLIWATFLFTALIWNTRRQAKQGKPANRTEPPSHAPGDPGAPGTTAKERVWGGEQLT